MALVGVTVRYILSVVHQCSFQIWDTSSEFAGVGNSPFATKVATLLTLKSVNRISRHERKIAVRVCV